MSLKEDLYKYLRTEKANYHMPGHKSRMPELNIDAFLDTTELEGTDNLHKAVSIIKAAEERAAKMYGAKRTRFMVAGASGGVISAIFAAAKVSSKILMARDSHKSAFNACYLKQLQLFVPELEFSSANVPLPSTKIKDMLLADEEIKTVLITTPTFYGYVRDPKYIQEIADILHARGGVLIADEAHGAHMEFCGLSHLSALHHGADLVIQSTHKSLPSMTMSAILHMSHNVSPELERNVDAALRLFQSSSPSYPIMISIDEGLAYSDVHRKEFEAYTQELREFRKKIDPDLLFGFEEADDPYKVYFNCNNYGYTGHEFQEILMAKGLNPEFATATGVLLYFSPMNNKEDIDLMLDALKSIKKREKIDMRALKYGAKEIDYDMNVDFNCTEFIDLKDAVGRIAAEDLTPYPPGIPFILRGEIMSQEEVDKLSHYANQYKEIHNSVIGLYEGQQIRVVKEEE